jgi:hypothetical protein
MYFKGEFYKEFLIVPLFVKGGLGGFGMLAAGEKLLAAAMHDA